MAASFDHVGTLPVTAGGAVLFELLRKYVASLDRV